MTEGWLHRANTPLARELLRAHRDERAPEAARVDALRVARVALAGSSAISVVAASSKASAHAATSTGGASSGAVVGSAAAGSAVAGSAAAGSAVVGSGVVGSGVVGSAAAGGSVLVGSASLPAPMLTAGALATGSGFGGAGTAASAAGAGWFATLGALGAFKLSVAALAVVGAGYLGAGAVDHWFPKAEPRGDSSLGTAAAPIGTAQPREGAAASSGTDTSATRAARVGPEAAPVGDHSGSVGTPRSLPDGARRAGEAPSPRAGGRTSPDRVSAAPARAGSGASAVHRGASPQRSTARRRSEGAIEVESRAAAASKAALPGGGSELPASQPASASPTDATSSRHLADELGLIRRAHEALRAGDATAARRWLERYEQRYPSGKLRPEASQLRRRLASVRDR